MRRAALVLVVTILVGSCGESEEPAVPSVSPPGSPPAALPEGAEALSLTGQPLHAPPLPDDVEAARRDDLERALEELSANPDDPDARIWVGRRYAYLGEYRRAIDTFTEGIEAFPMDPRFYRHRGHRWITVREFDRAIQDFRTAVGLIEGTDDEVEPDGMPNPFGIPTSTLHFNIWYHLALAHYLKGDLDAALEAWQRCMEVSTNPDAVVATSHWLYMTLRLLGREEDADAVLEPIRAEMRILENQAYHELLLLYRGELSPIEVIGPDEAGASLQATTTAYGVANWHRYNGRVPEAQSMLHRIVEGREQWAAFGYIAAEADLARLSPVR